MILTGENRSTGRETNSQSSCYTVELLIFHHMITVLPQCHLANFSSIIPRRIGFEGVIMAYLSRELEPNYRMSGV